MTWIVILVRTFVGLVFLVLGLNFFFHFFVMPQPENPPELAQKFAGALFTPVYGIVSYGFIIKVLEVLGAINLLSGRYSLLGIAILLPISINILLYEIFLLKQPGPGYLLVPMLLFILFGYRNAAKPVFDGTARIG